MAYGRLEVFWPDGQFKTYALTEPSISVGRSSGNTIALDSNTLSRYHINIRNQDGEVTVTDLDSANGTFVDSTKLKRDEAHVLYGGEEIQIGELRLIYYFLDETPTRPITVPEAATQRIELVLADTAGHTAAAAAQMFGPDLKSGLAGGAVDEHARPPGSGPWPPAGQADPPVPLRHGLEVDPVGISGLQWHHMPGEQASHDQPAARCEQFAKARRQLLQRTCEDIGQKKLGRLAHIPRASGPDARGKPVAAGVFPCGGGAFQQPPLLH